MNGTGSNAIAMRLGVLVNPLAGLGGRVGLKGTDGAGIAARALALGAVPLAPSRMALALGRFPAGVRMVAAPGDMGATEAKAAGFEPDVVGKRKAATDADDTVGAARALLAAGIDLLLFAGGDGTARDILGAIGQAVPVVGVPAGVKMHSALFAANPRAAGDLAHRFLAGRAPVRELEVMDIDEVAYRDGRVTARLYGYVPGPFDEALVQGVKIGGVRSEAAALASLAEAVARDVVPGRLVILGPGTTLRAIGERLGVTKTLLGIDLVRDGRLVAADANEATIREALGDGTSATIVVSPIGGQGFILGRGNQQLSPAVLRRVGPDNIVVVAAKAKIAALHHQTLRVDTGDVDLDHALSGYRRVITGVDTATICRVLA